jgi:hypothetical protein
MLNGLSQADLSFRHAAFRARRKLGQVLPIGAAAEKVWTIAEAETAETPPSLFLPGQPEKIRGLAWGGDWAIDRMRIFGGPMRRGAVVAYELRGAALVAGSILCKQSERRIFPYEAGSPPALNGSIADIKAAALTGSYLGLLYFGHWLRDDSTLELLANGYGDCVTPSPPDWPHCKPYRSLLGLTARNVDAARFEKLVVFDDEDYTTHKMERMRALRARAAKRVAPGKARGVFFKRGIRDANSRRLVNEEELAAALADDGFAVLDPFKASADEIGGALAGADILVGPEGSQLAHGAIFLREGAGLLAITAPERFSSGHKRWADHLGVRYGFVIGDAVEGGHSVSVDDLRRTMDLFGKATD